MDPLAPTVEDYLKTIYTLGQQDGTATTGSIARRLGISSPSVSGMLRRLRDQSLVAKSGPDQHGVVLTPAGTEHALAVIRRHRVVETFLFEVLDVPWDLVHAEAERLEHAASDDLVARMDRHLGHPDTDPHGDPIPRRGREHTEQWPTALSEAAPGERMSVERVSDRDSRALRYLAGCGVRPGSELRVVQPEPFGGGLHVEVDGQPQCLGPELLPLVHGRLRPAEGQSPLA